MESSQMMLNNISILRKDEYKDICFHKGKQGRIYNFQLDDDKYMLHFYN